MLFGRQRGSGESIWDIKKHIGYVSPEMHRSYIKNIPAIDIVASGFFDSIGLYLTPNDDQRAVCEEWLKTFEMGGLRDKSFVKLSSGEQRLLLLARAFVKDPDLLVLDEPFHGLDCYNKERARAVIEAFCRRPDKTMIYVTHYERELPRCVDKKWCYKNMHRNRKFRTTMNTYKLYQVDAFAEKLFTGNPAAVCPLDSWISDDLLQKIAMENNLAETAFTSAGATGTKSDGLRRTPR